MKYDFNAKVTKEKLVAWLKHYFATNASENTKAIVGISGGKDSSVVAALCVEALGKDRVYGVLMPNKVQDDIGYSKELVEFLGIENRTINIGEIVDAAYRAIGGELNSVVTNNTPARARMMVLYAVSGQVGGRVANTCNLSEDYVGYATKFGDAAGDFSPLSDLTVQEVKAIGRELGLPAKFIEKTPIDGLCGMTDEENLGFTYETLDMFIRGQRLPDKEALEKIEKLHKAGLHKLLPMPMFYNV